MVARQIKKEILYYYNPSIPRPERGGKNQLTPTKTMELLSTVSCTGCVRFLAPEFELWEVLLRN